MTDFADRQLALDREIFAQVLPCLPADWDKALLVASVTQTSDAGSTLSVQIEPLGQRGIAIVSDELQDALRRMFLAHHERRTGLRGIRYQYAKRPDGRWSFTADFDYVD